MKKSFLFVAAFLVVSIARAQEAAPPPPAWTSSLGAGVALTSGNSDTLNVNLSFATLYDPKTDHIFKADALYLRGEANEETQVDKTSANARYERTLGQAFWFGELSFLGDQLKGIDYLVSPVAGLGYYLLKDDRRTLSVDAGAGAAFERSDTLGSNSSPAVKAGQSFEWKISDTSRFTERLTGLWKTEDTGDALYHFDAGLATTIAARAELKLSYVYDYKNEPPPDIEKGDSAFFAALLYKF